MKYKKIKVTITEEYLIPVKDDRHTSINNWSIEEVIKHWFLLSNLNEFHATRDTHKIGNSKKFRMWELKERL